MPDPILPLVCDACSALTTTAGAVVDASHDRCPATTPGHWRRIFCDACSTEATETVTPGSPHDGCAASPPGSWFPVQIEDLDEDLAGPETAGPGYFTEEELGAHVAGPFDSAVRVFNQLNGAELPPALWGSHSTNSAGIGRCAVCGCTDAEPCPGGCLWANGQASLCSRCAVEGGTHV